MITLKPYQSRVLDSLRDFFRSAVRAQNPEPAFRETTARTFGTATPYIPVSVAGMKPQMPYVCLRVPTGGGKTLLACHAAGLAMTDFMRAERAVVLWLVPSNTILDQTADALRERLANAFGIAKDQVKIPVGTNDELPSADAIKSPKEPAVRFIITVQKLREGWDCPFAYVLCSLKETRSATAIEQIAGRILRLPNAQAKQHPDLNCAQAFSVSDSLPEVLHELREALESNGFTRAEAERMIIPVSPGALPLGEQYLDGRAEVKFWVRNLANKATSFRLQTSKHWFYPDFLCQLNDDRVLVVEYKGEHLFAEAEEKRAVGAVWESRSSGKCLFVMPEGKDLEKITQKFSRK